MARVTVEDCVDKIPNRFRLVLYSAQRSRELNTGAPPCIDQSKILKNEKKPVLALREIAEDVLDLEALEKALIKSHRRVSDPDEERAESSLADERERARARAGRRREEETTNQPQPFAAPKTPSLEDKTFSSPEKPSPA